ncbi:swi snf complex [Micractinium conductrix]|uniref:Swi snf complex n=1 Tax=Micractinium conductrix TaxID=554055 RepID=A0A2P6VDM2_9CHLO|nr:swi snf complex [Micractinium conductrix]|eukprot:PSC72177.1 swi snf complex [Micractinium conductrix]
MEIPQQPPPERPVCPVGKRNGSVQQERFADADYLASLEPLAARLNSELPGGPKFDRKALAQLFAGLMQFMEDALGVNSMYRTFTRLPAQLLLDPSPEGPLWLVAAACVQHIKTRNLKRIDWLAPNARKENIELFGRIRAELLRGGYIRTPVVFVHPSCGTAEEREKLQEAVRTLKGEVAQEQGNIVSHVVHPAGEAGDAGGGQRYARTLEVKGAQARLHWLYLPDSYDEWVPAAAAPMPAEPPRRPRGPWHLTVRWLLDSEKFNEWMNEADYVAEAAAAEEAKRKREGDDEPSRKPKAARQAGPLPEIQAGAGRVVAEGVVQQKVVQPNRKAMEVASAVDISQGQRAEGVLMPHAAVQVAPEQQGAAGAANGEQQEEGEEAYLVPACAAWFRWDAIAEVEEAHFKDFLAADPANAERYREYRNAMVNKYREDQSRELSFTEARRALVGDVNLLRRIWKFLASWQLINFLARRQGAPAGGAGPAGGAQQQGASRLGASGVGALHAAPQRVGVEEGALAALSGAGGVRVRPHVLGNWMRLPALASKADFYCRGADCGTLCTPLRHHCLKKPDLDLCPTCFKEGKFPPGMSARDFVRLEAADAVPDGSGWTDQETLLLLEGIEKYGESWQQVAEQVGGRSAMQCVSRFLQLPTEEVLMADAEPGPHTTGLVAIPPPRSSRELSAAVATIEEVLPFADVGNPVLAQVSFLAAMVGPKIASAAAQRALEALAEEDAAAAAAVADELAAQGGGDVLMAAGEKQGNGAAADKPVSAGRMRVAAATGLAAAAVQAKLLADQEEREVQRLVVAAIENLFKKVHAKLQYLEELDDVMASERLNLEAMRGKFLDEHAKAVADNVAAGLGPPPGRPAPAAAAGAGAGAQ